jgi:hypothetical protein
VIVRARAVSRDRVETSHVVTSARLTGGAWNQAHEVDDDGGEDIALEDRTAAGSLRRGRHRPCCAEAILA